MFIAVLVACFGKVIKTLTMHAKQTSDDGLTTTIKFDVSFDLQRTTISDLVNNIKAERKIHGNTKVTIMCSGKVCEGIQRVAAYPWQTGVWFMVVGSLKGGAVKKGTIIKTITKEVKLNMAKTSCLETVKKAKDQQGQLTTSIETMVQKVESVGNTIYNNMGTNPDGVWEEWLNQCSASQLEKALTGLAKSNDESVRISRIGESLFSEVIGPLDEVGATMSLCKEGFLSVLTLLSFINVSFKTSQLLGSLYTFRLPNFPRFGKFVLVLIVKLPGSWETPHK